MQKAKLYKKGATFKSLGGKSYGIKGGSHKMTAMMLTIINLTMHNFHPGFLKVASFLYILTVVAWNSLFLVPPKPTIKRFVLHKLLFLSTDTMMII